MDLRTGRMYASIAEARAAGVPESDIAHVVMTPEQNEMFAAIPKVSFAKHRPFASFKNITSDQADGATTAELPSDDPEGAAV